MKEQEKPTCYGKPDCCAGQRCKSLLWQEQQEKEMRLRESAEKLEKIFNKVTDYGYAKKTHDGKPDVLDFIDYLKRRVVDAECSARGNQSTFEEKDKKIKILSSIIKDAMLTERVNYSTFTKEEKPEWLLDAHVQFPQIGIER